MGDRADAVSHLCNKIHLFVIDVILWDGLQFFLPDKLQYMQAVFFLHFF